MDLQKAVLPGLIVALLSALLALEIDLRGEVAVLSARVNALEAGASQITHVQDQIIVNREAIAILRGILDQARFENSLQ